MCWHSTGESTIKIKSTIAIALAAASMFAVPTASAADYDIGCSFDRWGFLGGQVCAICDWPRRADGSWPRVRNIYVPEHTNPARSTCSSGSYSSTCTYREKQFVEEREIETIYYDLTDDTVPPGEPGWLPEHAMVGNA
jgi:hypothetical protein